MNHLVITQEWNHFHALEGILAARTEREERTAGIFWKMCSPLGKGHYQRTNSRHITQDLSSLEIFFRVFRIYRHVRRSAWQNQWESSVLRTYTGRCWQIACFVCCLYQLRGCSSACPKVSNSCKFFSWPSSWMAKEVMIEKACPFGNAGMWELFYWSKITKSLLNERDRSAFLSTSFSPLSLKDFGQVFSLFVYCDQALSMGEWS